MTGAGTLTATGAVLTGLAAIGCVFFLIAARRDRDGHQDRRWDAPTLSQAAWWSALISLLGVFANAWPIAVLPGCTG